MNITTKFHVKIITSYDRLVYTVHVNLPVIFQQCHTTNLQFLFDGSKIHWILDNGVIIRCIFWIHCREKGQIWKQNANTCIGENKRHSLCLSKIYPVDDFFVRKRKSQLVLKHIIFTTHLVLETMQRHLNHLCVYLNLCISSLSELICNERYTL